MRKLSLLLFAGLTLGGAGCGKDGPTAPPSLTPEQIEAANQEQKKVDGEEKSHLKADPANKKGPAGEVNPATQQIDFYIRSPQQNPKNTPAREVFMHFFGMEVTWK